LNGNVPGYVFTLSRVAKSDDVSIYPDGNMSKRLNNRPAGDGSLPMEPSFIPSLISMDDPERVEYKDTEDDVLEVRTCGFVVESICGDGE